MAPKEGWMAAQVANVELHFQPSPQNQLWVQESTVPPLHLPPSHFDCGQMYQEATSWDRIAKLLLGTDRCLYCAWSLLVQDRQTLVCPGSCDGIDIELRGLLQRNLPPGLKRYLRLRHC